MRYIFRIETNLDDYENEPLMMCMFVDIVGMIPSSSVSARLLQLGDRKRYVLTRHIERNTWLIPANLFKLCRPYTTINSVRQIRSKTFEVEVL